MDISDPNNYLAELKLEESDNINEDDEIYYTILQEEDENYKVETVDEEYLDASDNVFYLSLTNEEEAIDTQESIIEENGINMALLEEVTLPDGTQAFLTRDLNADGNLEDNINDEMLEPNDDSPMLLQDISESLECEINMKSDEEIDDFQTVLYRSDDSNAIFDESEYEHVLLEDGGVAMIERGLYKSILGQNNKNKKKANASIKMYECPTEDCNKSFTTMHYLRVHMRKHSGSKPYKCNAKDCDKAFATGYSLKAHSRTHTGEKPYGCSTCVKSFKTSGDLQKHIRIHTGEKPFLCPVEGCGRSFTTSNIRKVHIRSHTGERPYQCPEPGCFKAFASATNYKNHIRIHSGEKPYVCSVETCGKRFTEYSSLYKHHMVHDNSKEFKCTYCDRVFRQQSSLTTHKRTAHDIIATDNGTEIMIKMIENEDGSSSPNIYTKILLVSQ